MQVCLKTEKYFLVLVLEEDQSTWYPKVSIKLMNIKTNSTTTRTADFIISVTILT